MFKCEISGRISKPGEKSFKVVTKTRPKTYSNKLKHGEKVITKTTQGWEIAEEKIVCEKVYRKLTNESNR